MKYNELVLQKQTKPTRAGRGISAGRGKTAGRGTKGQGARKSTPRPGFEGGQMPIYMRLPKLRGFKSKRPRVEEVYTGQLDQIKAAVIDTKALADVDFISSAHVFVKLLVKGELTSKKTVKLPFASAGAVKAIEKNGGKFEKTARLGRASSKPTIKH